jgi:hypothetical protein
MSTKKNGGHLIVSISIFPRLALKGYNRFVWIEKKKDIIDDQQKYSPTRDRNKITLYLMPSMSQDYLLLSRRSESSCPDFFYFSKGNK